MDGKGSDGRFILVDLGFRILRFLWDCGWGMSTRLEGGKDGLEWAFGGMGPRCSSGFGLGLTVESGGRRCSIGFGLGLTCTQNASVYGLHLARGMKSVKEIEFPGIRSYLDVFIIERLRLHTCCSRIC